MSIRGYLFILSIIFLTSGTSSILLLLYMNPISNPELSFGLLGASIFLAGSSLLAPLIFFCKKIYYRGDVTVSTINASIRQAILFMIGFIFIKTLWLYHIHDDNIILTAIATIACVEVIFQAIH